MSGEGEGEGEGVLSLLTEKIKWLDYLQCQL